MIQRLRFASLLGVHLLILIHIFIFGDETIGSLDFQEFFHAFLKQGIINSGVLLVIIAFITTLIFGRFFCGWGCHFGALQEFSWWLIKKIDLETKTINSNLVTILPLFMLINFYVMPNLIYAINTPWEGIRVKLSFPEIWAFLPGFIIGLMTFLVDGFLIIYFLGRKGFCRFICPWGAFLKLPNSLAMFKVRHTGGCIESGHCTSNCPVGIDVSYEINNYGKVTNTNCTACMICTDGCPSSALSYKWKNPLNENFQLKHYGYNKDMYQLKNIKDQFYSFKHQDYFLFIIVLIFGFSIDGLYGMGHFLSFGIALIASIQIMLIYKKNNYNSLRTLLITIITFIFIWHGIIKYSIWQGLNQFENHKYHSSIIHLKRAVLMYPKPIGRFHLLIGQMYLENGELKLAKYHAVKAKNINPDHESPLELLQKIDSLN